MDDATVEGAVAGLRSAAQQLRDAITKANQLPDKFPVDYVGELLNHVQEIDSSDEDSIRLATHLRDKLLLTVDLYHPDDLTGGPAFLKTLHNDLFVAVSRFLQVTQSGQRFPDFERRKGRSTFDRRQYEELRQHLLVQATTALRDAKRAEGEVHKYIQQNGIINIGEINFGDVKLNIELALTKARRAITAIVLELKSTFIDLDWLAEFAGFVGKCAELIARAVQNMDIALRDSPMVRAIRSFIQTTVSFVDRFRLFIRESVIREPAIDEKSGSPAQLPEPEKMGVKAGQRYRDKGGSFGVVWEVEEVLIASDLKPSYQSGGRGDIWHARLVSVVGGRRGAETKLIGVSVLRDKTYYEQIPDAPTAPAQKPQ